MPRGRGGAAGAVAGNSGVVMGTDAPMLRRAARISTVKGCGCLSCEQAPWRRRASFRARDRRQARQEAQEEISG